MFLEVRPSNPRAIALYERSGFNEIGRRPRYYPDHHGGREDAIVIPEAAVQFGNQGNYVYVVNEDLTAAVRQVTLGAGHEGRVAVAAGLEPGERVVLEGLDRLREGGKVEIVGDGSDDAGDDAASAEGAQDGAAAAAPAR